jgi:hypothetical protein
MHIHGEDEGGEQRAEANDAAENKAAAESKPFL